MSDACPRRWTAGTFAPPRSEPLARPPAPLNVVKRQVQVLLARAREQADCLRAQAEQEGLAAGRQEGLDELRHVQQEHAQELRLSLDRLQKLYHDSWERMRHEMEQSLLELALEVSREVIKEEIQSSPDRLLGQIRQGLDRLGEREGAILRLNPQDCAALPEGCLSQLRLVADPELERGDFVAESEGGIVDGRLSRRIDLVRRQLSA